MERSHPTMMIWAARVLGMLFSALVGFMVMGHAFSPEGLPPFWREPLRVQLDFLALFLMTIGGVGGWKWPRAAAMMVLGGYALWQVIERRLPWPPGVIELPGLVGLLYASSWITAANSSDSDQPAASR